MPDPNQDLPGWLEARLRSIKEAKLRSHCYVPIPCASISQLEELRHRAHGELGAQLPEEYLLFLSLQNGGGEFAALFGTHAYQIASPQATIHITGLIEENLRLRHNTRRFAGLIVFGETDLDHIVMDTTSGAYFLQSRIGGELFEKLRDFTAVLELALT